MAFCRGCAKELHDSAQSCPQCGAVQYPGMSSSPHWSAIVTLILSVLLFLSVLSVDLWDTDSRVGIVLFSMFPISFGIYSLTEEKLRNEKWMSIVGIVLSALSVLCAF
ncbi:hypothetical protein [Variovorax terrae]|uniref:Uncharacterized protein n=1 Tax=Variovorax terrae TaxID=2923278 RepID=A0A9X1VYG0_9BURK|nr:hypothetical protein [Variovorax terrae]MCJ0766196.1 hypothetical protein [Variovorax terrae]